MIITGKSADGSDAHEPLGAFVSSCGTYWSSKPITKEQKAYQKVWEHCIRHRKTMGQLYWSIKLQTQKENLPKWVRTWFVEWFEND
jgi:hypothetical protein